MGKDKHGQGGLRDKLRNLGKEEVQEIGFKEGKIENGQYQDNVWLLDLSNKGGYFDIQMLDTTTISIMYLTVNLSPDVCPKTQGCEKQKSTNTNCYSLT